MLQGYGYIETQVLPSDEERVLLIMKVLAIESKNPFAEVEMAVLEDQDSYRLVACPNTNPICYLTYTKKTRMLSSCSQRMLVALICNALPKESRSRFFELVYNYNGKDFLDRLFGLGKNESYLKSKEDDIRKLKPSPPHFSRTMEAPAISSSDYIAAKNQELVDSLDNTLFNSLFGNQE